MFHIKALYIVSLQLRLMLPDQCDQLRKQLLRPHPPKSDCAPVDVDSSGCRKAWKKQAWIRPVLWTVLDGLQQRTEIGREYYNIS